MLVKSLLYPLEDPIRRRRRKPRAAVSGSPPLHPSRRREFITISIIICHHLSNVIHVDWSAHQIEATILARVAC